MISRAVRAARLARNYFRPKALVLMYHRVAVPEYDSWEIAVSPANFEQHLQVLKRFGNVISTNELLTGLATNTLKRRSVAITFDDGYLDNYLVAKPLLETYQLPATFFIASGSIGQERAYWWDELSQLIFASAHLPSHFSLLLAGRPIEFALGNEQHLSPALQHRNQHWKAASAAPPSLRAALYYQLWETIKALPHPEQQRALDQIRAWAGPTTAPQQDCRVMSLPQLRELSSSPYFTIGAHTVTHPALASHLPDFQNHELRTSRQQLEQMTAISVGLLAYPYGNCGAETVAIAATTFDAAFTTEARSATKWSDRYRLGRFQVNNWQGPVFHQQLNQWFQAF